MKVIKDGAFLLCSQLATVDCDEGLEEIGMLVFEGCTSRREILIPLAIKAIKERTLKLCTQLSIVNPSEELEEIRRKDSVNAHRFNASSSPPLSQKFTRKHSSIAKV